MYAVGVGKAVEDELREIASDPVEKHFYYTADFAAISTIAENLRLNVCPGRSLTGHLQPSSEPPLTPPAARPDLRASKRSPSRQI